MTLLSQDLLNELAARCINLKKNASSTNPATRQVFVGIGGPPGSGKSTIAMGVSSRLNELIGEKASVVLPMDGYHLSRAELRRLGSSGAIRPAGKSATYEELLARRGSPWTFDPSGFCRDLILAKQTGKGSFPVYSRVESDPVPDGVELTEEQEIVLCEGNYVLCLEEAEWSPLGGVWDDKWYVDVSDGEVLRDRLVDRHLETWTEEKTKIWGSAGRGGARAKAEANDLKNAAWIERRSKKFADLIVRND